MLCGGVASIVALNVLGTKVRGGGVAGGVALNVLGTKVRGGSVVVCGGWCGP